VEEFTPMDHETDYIDDEGYRANVGIVIMNDDRQVFLGGRARARGWQFPQGGIRRGERAKEALYRELAEEVGLRPGQVEEIACTRSWLRYRLPPQFIRRDSSPLCIGQKQRWFLLRLGAEDNDFSRWLEHEGDLPAVAKAIRALDPEVKTVELNSTPYATLAYRALGFVPISREFEQAGCRATRMACWLPARGLNAGLD